MDTLNITLHETTFADIALFFQFQLDEAACRMAAFTSKDGNDKAAYLARWEQLLKDPSISIRTIKVDDVIVGSVSKYVLFGDAEITYWLDKNYWDKGIATFALKEFLKLETTRPLYGRIAYDNYGSQKVLERNGFVKIGEDKGFAKARDKEIVEFVFVLNN